MTQVVIEAPAIAGVEDRVLVARAVAAREQGERSSWEEADAYVNLVVLGWTQQRVADACGTNQSRVSKFVASAKNYSVLNNRPTFWEAFSEVNSEKPATENHRAKGTGENEWYTPVEYVAVARDVMGGIDLDPASSDVAQEAIRATTYYTRADDGLTKEWVGRIWLNPPYAQPAIQQFAEKAVAEISSGRVTQAVVLTHNYTDTAWFHALASVCDAMCFTRGRIGFLSPTGERAAPTQGQTFFYAGASISRFADAFSHYGLIMRP